MFLESALPAAAKDLFESMVGGLIGRPSVSPNDVMAATYASIDYRGGSREDALAVLFGVIGVTEMVMEGKIKFTPAEKELMSQSIAQGEGVWTDREEFGWLDDACENRDEEVLDLLADLAEMLGLKYVCSWVRDGLYVEQ